MGQVTYPLRLDSGLYERLELEARRRSRPVSDLMRETIGLGLGALPPPVNDSLDGVVADSWARLGPAPDVDYDKL